MDVPMELSRVLITEFGEQQIIVLKEKGGGRSFPIQIGTSEALAIHRRLNDKKAPRPMTHDLLADVIDAMGGRLEKIVINDLVDHTFIATIHIRRGETLVEVDSRPSDAIALGVAFETPIFVAHHVLTEVTKEPTQADRIELLRRRMDMLAEKIAEVAERLDDQDFLASVPPSVIDEHRRRLDEMKTEHEAIDRLLKKLG